MKAIVILALMATVSFAADCTTGETLHDTLEITRLETSIAVDDSLPFCQNLIEDGESCCSVEVVQSIQDKIDETRQTLEDMFGDRDQENADAFNRVRENFEDAVEVMIEVGEQVGELNDDVLEQFEEEVEVLEGQLDEQVEAVSELKKEFRDMQKDRVKCLKVLLDLQASAYCTACKVDYSSELEDSELVLGEETCGRVKSACFSFMERAQQQSQAVEMGQFAEELGEGTKNMEEALPELKELVGKAKTLKRKLPLAEGGEGQVIGQNGQNPPPPPEGGESPDTPFKDVFKDVDLGDEDMSEYESFTLPKFSFSEEYDASGQPEKKRVQKPDGCNDEEDCDWMCSNFFENGKIIIENAALGGETVDEVPVDEDLADSANLETLGQKEDEEEQQRILSSRILTSGNWEPSEGMSGASIEVDEDPSGAGAQVEDELDAEEEDEDSDSASKMASSLFITLGLIFSAILA